MKVKINNQDYWITFNHKVSGKTLRDSTSVTTRCVIETKGFLKVTSGIAVCNLKHDRFVKETGRKLSLERALVFFDKDTRKLFWEAYHSRKQC